MRIYEATKKLNITNTETKKLLEQIGISVSNNFQSIDDITFVKLKNIISKQNEPVAGLPEQTSKEATTEIETATETQTEQTKEEDTAADPEQPLELAASENQKELQVVKIPLGLNVKDFSELIGYSPAEIIKKLFALGEMVTINQQISPEAINVLADEFNFKPEIVEAPEEELEEEGLEGTPESRSPVVTVMGHVDHGKTSLLDSIRKTNVISGESGGITQHIGAYQVAHNEKAITFIDTPGHEAFTAMRARGAKMTDIAVLVVAADDGVKAQTVEAIDHARAAGVPIIVAINKIDKPSANPEKVKTELSEFGLVPEEWGGDTVFVEVSAKQNINIDDLLEMILIVSEVLELKAPKDVPAKGFVIEARLEKGRGPVITVLVQKGILSIGQIILAGTSYGRIRALVDDKGRRIKIAEPSQPVEILGLSSLPEAGDEAFVIDDERRAKQIIESRKDRMEVIKRGLKPGVASMERMMSELGKKELKLVVKADVRGSLEALVNEFEKLSTDEVKINVIRKGVGGITETDIMLAAASEAFVIGFNVRPDTKAREMAEKENIEMRLHKVIYQAIDDVQSASRGMMKPLTEEEDVGRLEVRAVFKVPKLGHVAGCYVTEGEINKGNLVRLVRDGVVVYDGKVASLRRFKEDAQTVKTGFECGLGLENFKDIKEGDIIEVYRIVEKPRT